MQALEVAALVEPPAEIDVAPPAPNNGGPPNGGGGGPVPIDELVPVMDPAAVENGASAAGSPSTPVMQEAPAAAQTIALPPNRTWWLGRSAR